MIGGVKANCAWMPVTDKTPKFPLAPEVLVDQHEFLDDGAQSVNSNGMESKSLTSKNQPYIVEIRNEDDKLARIMFKSKTEKTTLQRTAAGLCFPHLKSQMTNVLADVVRHAALDIPTYWTGTHPLSMICALTNERTCSPSGDYPN